VLKLRSVNNIVIPAARTGSESKSKIAVTKTAHTNKGIKSMRYPGNLIFIIVTIKFIAPKIEDKPARCKLNIAKSTAAPICPSILKGG